MTVFRNDGQWDTSNVEFQHGKIVTYDKLRPSARMRYIDYGLGLFDHRAFELVDDSGSRDLATLYQSLLAAGELAGHEVTERFYEIGSVAGLEETREFLAERGRFEGEYTGSGHVARSTIFG